MIDIFSPAVWILDYYINLLASGDNMLERSKRFLEGTMGKETNSKRNYENVPSNATIRSEHIKCGRFCSRCPHGPYYYAYWKDQNGELRKKYIGTKYDDSSKDKVSVKISPKAELTS